jgi:hypothetical protein
MLSTFRDNNLISLIELGMGGHFPLFQTKWLRDVGKWGELTLSKDEQKRANRLIKRISNHKSLERKKVIMDILDEDDRDLLIRSFITTIEAKMLDEKYQLQ